MIIFGILLLIIGFVTGIPVVWAIGMIVLVIGLILALLGAVGHAVGGRRHYFLTCDPDALDGPAFRARIAREVSVDRATVSPPPVVNGPCGRGPARRVCDGGGC